MATQSKTVALLVAAGKGTRAGQGVPKQFSRLSGKSILAHAIDHLQHPGIDEILVVIAPGQDALFAEATGGYTLPAPVEGAETRQGSVLNGLEALAARGDVGTVLVHDAARPFLPSEVIDRLLDGLVSHPGAVPVLPVADSLAEADETVGASIDRNKLMRIQTPQAFRFDGILSAHRAWTDGAEATDDAQVARAAGLDVITVPGDPRLDKLTYPEDFLRAERLHASSLITRTGLGFDVHAFAEGESLWLGGVQIPHSRGLSGHSDADVVLHAITDALLGSIGEGDIGDHFPPSDPQWRGAASSVFLDHARSLVERHGGRISNVDVTIICEEPKIGPHRRIMRETIAGLLGVPIGAIGVKATTTERLGFTGRGEGIAAQAVATIRAPEMT